MGEGTRSSPIVVYSDRGCQIGHVPVLLLSVTKLIEIAFFSAPINRAEKSAGLTEGGFFGVVVWVKRVLLLPRSALSFCQELLFSWLGIPPQCMGRPPHARALTSFRG